MNEFLLGILTSNSVVIPGVFMGYNYDTKQSTGSQVLTPSNAMNTSAISPALSGYSKMQAPANGSINLAGAAPLSTIGTGDFTIELFGLITSTAGGYSTFLCVMTSGGNQMLTVRVGDGGYGNRLQFSMNPYNQTECFASPKTRNDLYNKWVHISVMRKNGLAYVWVDGVPQQLATGTNTDYSSGARNMASYNLSAANYIYTAAGTCVIEEFVIYNAAIRTPGVSFTRPSGGPLAR